ncbi:hypothetical protein RG836_18840 [Pseudomonas sp. SZMC_28357]|uniref:dermonecrotic toxin domain-containing protein n=1 Tax=Pseudomonas sp. SZMC_28357 TaxID=3074380 RepID=UPI0028719B89|nr:DUF6543 domain-containing protein [Pseudomonas sp. SZMC_28357]MDR9753509.1 hypothetical protein [Pseudomonas sp. SZMC_28357]
MNSLTNKPSSSIHHEFIESALPDWLTTTSAQRASALKASTLGVEPWIRQATDAEHQRTASALGNSWRSQNTVDRMLSTVQNIADFAEPLLKKALKKQYQLDVDVREVYVRLYSRTSTITQGSRARTVSLLDAALHNFQQSETLLPDSEFITRPNNAGHFNVSIIGRHITITQFKTLCRELDIGARYHRHLQEFLRPVDPMVRRFTQHQIIQSQKDALYLAAQLALMKKDIGLDGYRVVAGMLEDRKDLRFDGRPVHYHHLSIMNIQLSGIVLIAGDLDTSGHQGRVIAYVPHDPEHPLKEYASGKLFADELTRQLRRSTTEPSGRMTYLQFFIRFVAHQQRGALCSGLNSHLVQTTWHPTVKGVDLPNWRDTDVANPRLHFGALAFEDDIQHRYHGDLWRYLYEQQLNKIFNDAREIAVSTADADRRERWAWIDNLEKMLSEVVNVALLVVTPFVPLLGELMLAYTAYHMVSELVEGVVDLAEGLYLEGANYLIDFTESLIQFGTFGAGMQLGQLAWSRLSPFIENTRQVTLVDGRQRLWHPDLEPYARKDLNPPADAPLDEHGLALHQGRRILRTDSHRFELEQDRNGTHRLKHPTRADAYRPKVHSNGAGAFVIEGEQPQVWDDDTLMKRLGASADSLADSFSDIRKVSRTDIAAIRQMYVGRERALPLLDDTLARFKIDRELQTFIDRLAPSRLALHSSADVALQLQLLADNGLWPSDKPLQLVAADGEIVWQTGSGAAAPVRISQGVDNSTLLETLLSHLDNRELKHLMETELGGAVGDLHTNANRLRAELRRLAIRQRLSLFESRYRTLGSRAAVPVQNLMDQVPGLPVAVARELLSLASPVEFSELALGRLPARLKGLAEHARREVRLSRMYEGLYLRSVENPDTDKLILHTAAHLRGWPTDVLIQVRQFEAAGAVQDSIGPADAMHQRMLVAREDGTFELHDAQGKRLHSATDLYSAVVQALSEDQLTTLGIRDGEQLADAVRNNTLPPYRLTRVLTDLTTPRPIRFDPSVMRLRGGAPTGDDEVAQLLRIAENDVDLVQPAFQSDSPQHEQFSYLRGLKLMHDDAYPEECFNQLWQAFFDANTAGDGAAHQRVVSSIEALPELKKLMDEAPFNALLARLFTEEGLVPLSDSERDLASMARNFEQTGRGDEYLALQRAQREDQLPEITPLDELHRYLPHDALPAPVTVSPEILAHLQMAQRAIVRAKELIPLSGNQLPSIWEKGSSAIQKLKALREIDPLTGQPKAQLSTAEAVSRALQIRGGNCSENSKVTFALLAAEARPVDVHIVAARDFDHQFVLIGNDLGAPDSLVVADPWPEFPAAHLASEAVFSYHAEPILTLPAGAPQAEFAFIRQQPAGPAPLPIRGSDDSILRLIRLNKLSYNVWTSLRTPGQTYATPGAVPISFQRLPTAVIENRISAYRHYKAALQTFIDGQNQVGLPAAKTVNE